jgi:hypothetical protein
MDIICTCKGLLISKPVGERSGWKSGEGHFKISNE